MRLKDLIARAFMRYLETGGCALPGCPCYIHKLLGIPQAEYLAEVLTPRPSAYPRGMVALTKPALKRPRDKKKGSMGVGPCLHSSRADRSRRSLSNKRSPEDFP